jgi:protein TonB
MMFEQITLVEGAGRTKPWSFAASITVQSILLATALAVPMLHVAQLETKIPVGLFLPRALGAREQVHEVTSRTPSANLLTQTGRTYKPFQAPSHIPTKVAMGPDLPGAPVYEIGAGGGGISAGIDLPGVGDLTHQQPLAVAPPEPRHPAPAVQQPPIRVGPGVEAAKLVFGPKPAYPQLAKQARISGTVRLAALISADGRIRDLRVVSGHPMLIQAAIEAVRQWVYRPTLLNGEPVEVQTDIEVNFVLQ